jgi:enamine deaminase RidA (YjgF/YER057c/UK114 family)
MAKRQPIAGKGIPEHPQPFPAALRIGNMIFSAGIGTKDAERNVDPESPAEQVAQAFENMRRIVEAGGGQIGDIAKVVVYLKDRKDRDLVNSEWIKMFPDENDRPVRHSIPTDLPRNRVIQLEFIAVL